MMEEVREQKFLCKFCNKCCFSGKSLGGHMRCHLALISAARREKLKTESQMDFEGCDGDRGNYGIQENSNNSFRVSAEKSNSSLIAEKVENRSSMCVGSDDQDQDQENYGLRENPKKSSKASDLRNRLGPRKGNLCKQCCKRFPSSRALAGHMRSHSVKLRVRHLCDKCGKGFDSMRAMYGHMKTHSKRSRFFPESVDGLSDFDIICPRKKRSAMRYKFGQNIPRSTAIVSSSVNEPDEVVDAAMSLMMLSMGERNWDGFNGPVENIGNAIPVDFEAKSFSDNEGMTKIAGDDFVRDPNEADKTEKQIEELNFCFSGSGDSFSKQNASEFKNVGSEFGSGSDKRTELEAPVNESPCSDKSRKSRHLDVSSSDWDDPNINKAYESAGIELPNDGIVAVGMDQKDLQWADSNPCKQLKFEAPDLELEGNSSDVAKRDHAVSEILKDNEKKREYKCSKCNSIFRSHQALGGHRNRHKILGSCSAPNTETCHLSENKFNGTPSGAGSGGVATAVAFSESSKGKEHECPVCFRVFSTGQALGGHKRAHYGAFTETRIKETAVANQEVHNIQNIFGLNISVIANEGARSDVGFNKPWWSGSGNGTDPLLISN